MIHDVGKALQAQLAARGCPFKVFDREGTKTATFGNERIVIEHDEAGDRFVSVKSQHTNAKHRYTRGIGVKITIFAQSARSGALEFEHRRRAEQALDHVLVALGDVAGEQTPIFNVFTVNGGRFIVPDDLQGSERYGGAVYELTVTIDRAVKVQTWAGDKAPEATLGDDLGITSTTNVSTPGELGTETACGA